MRIGPRITILKSCSGCAYVVNERYATQGDSGHDVYCAFYNKDEPKYIGDTKWDTPNWCPVMNTDPVL